MEDEINGKINRWKMKLTEDETTEK